MHYGADSFSSNGSPTIDAKRNTIGHRAGVSEHDIIQTRVLYQCDSRIRSYSEYLAAPCTSECKCTLGMTGCGSDNNACHGDLVCTNDSCQVNNGPPPTTPGPTTEPPAETPEPCPISTCGDDPDYRVKGKPSKDCKWIGNKTNRSCKKGDTALM